jgi:hypothetical protein
MSTLLRKLLPAAAAAVMLIPSAAARADVSDVRIAVSDSDSGDEIAVLSPEDSFEMAEGQSVDLQLFEPSGRGRRNLAGTFGFGPSQRGLELVDSDPGSGSATVRLRPPYDRNNLHIGYKLAGSVRLEDEDLRLGRIMVRPVAAEQDQAQAPSAGRGTDFIVDELYRGILMRGADDDAKYNAGRNIRSQGYDAVVRLADSLARSDESQRGVYRNGTSNQERLAAMYEHLLGWSTDDVDESEWRSQLNRLGRGDVAGVVSTLVRSDEFRERFDM